jgi:hypothetical protein
MKKLRQPMGGRVSRAVFLSNGQLARLWWLKNFLILEKFKKYRGKWLIWAYPMVPRSGQSNLAGL